MLTLLDKSKELLSKKYIRLLLVYLFFLSIFSLIYFSIDRFTSLDDHFFHIRFAEIIKEKGLDAFRDFKWLYFSKIAQDQAYFVYYNFLFYLVLIPFTFIKPLFLGIKLYAVIFASLYFTIFYFFLSKISEKKSFFWTVTFLAIVSDSSIWRFFLTRPYAFAPAIILLELYFLHKRKYVVVFLISFFYLYWHSVTFFFPLIVAFIYFLFDKLYTNKFNWKILTASATGILGSLIITSFFAPGFFSFMKDIYFNMFQETLIGKKVSLAEGNELYAADFFSFIRQNVLLITLLIIAVVFELRRYIEEKRNENPIVVWQKDKKRALSSSLFLLSIGFLLGTFISRRNGDFFVFFSAAYVAIIFNNLAGYVQFKSELVKKSLMIGLIIAAIYLFSGNLLSVHEQIASTGPYDSIEGSANWLKENAGKGEIIFNPTWNWFTLLFYYDPDNYYIAGIEPRFLYDYSHELYWAWWNISNNGYLCSEEKCDEIVLRKKYFLRDEEKKKIWYNEGRE